MQVTFGQSAELCRQWVEPPIRRKPTCIHCTYIDMLTNQYLFFFWHLWYHVLCCTVCVVSSEGAATTNSVTTDDGSLSVRRDLSREHSSEESETRLVYTLSLLYIWCLWETAIVHVEYGFWRPLPFPSLVTNYATRGAYYMYKYTHVHVCVSAEYSCSSFACKLKCMWFALHTHYTHTHIHTHTHTHIYTH